MKAGRWIHVLNPYDWLPSYGESAVSLTNSGLDLVVTIEYDGSDGAVQHKELLFEGTCFFYRASLPGPYMLDVVHDCKVTPPHLGALVEYPDSEAALVWRKHYGGSRKVNHYRIVFLSENLILEVLAGSVVLRAEISSA
ncbi:hypothetical protein ACIP1U_19380 [Cupriavidus sp. NPDC089707]|uniref:hypothetical protein n=1 Tax=Cupriavidus sp. NPDC089707 TaxID=3363963 RepID=UPI0037F60B0A